VVFPIIGATWSQAKCWRILMPRKIDCQSARWPKPTELAEDTLQIGSNQSVRSQQLLPEPCLAQQNEYVVATHRTKSKKATRENAAAGD